VGPGFRRAREGGGSPPGRGWVEEEVWWQKVADNPHMALCLNIASLGIDELARAGLIPWTEFDRAKKVIAEEIFVGLCLNDLPPPGVPGPGLYPGKVTRLGEGTSGASAKPPHPPR